jgi:hypothetical protein
MQRRNITPPITPPARAPLLAPLLERATSADGEGANDVVDRIEVAAADGSLKFDLLKVVANSEGVSSEGVEGSKDGNNVTGGIVVVAATPSVIVISTMGGGKVPCGWEKMSVVGGGGGGAMSGKVWK